MIAARIRQLIAALFLIIALQFQTVNSFQRFGPKIKASRFSASERQPRWRSSHVLRDSTSSDVKIISKGDVHRVEATVAGKVISFETGKIGRQASGAVVGQVGDTIVYSTACYDREAVPIDFTPLKVDYFARYSAVGQTIGAFHRRDSRGDDAEILVARLIDRPLRPVLLEGWQHDTQILAWVLSYDKIHSSEVLAINCASAALAISDIPLVRPIAGVEVGLVGGQYIVNPTREERLTSDLVLTLAGSRNGILMIEGVSRFVTEEQMMQALTVGHAAIVQLCDVIDVFQGVAGKAKKRDTLHSLPHSLTEEMDRFFGERVRQALSIHDKHERGREVGLIEEEILSTFTTSSNPTSTSTSPSVTSSTTSPTSSSLPLPSLDQLTSESVAGIAMTSEDEPVSLGDDDVALSERSDESAPSVGEDTSEEDEASELLGMVKSKPRAEARAKAGMQYDAIDVKIAVKKLLKKRLRDIVLTTGRRSDGRTVEEVRPISIETNWLPGTHGSALFTRGETQTIATATLGTRGMEARVESLDDVGTKRFYLQYRFPPSSVGETGRVGMVTRREVGHGNLAERALSPVIPESSLFPYSMRAESLITESSGSSSMATVCGCCIAMLDAGVPLTSLVAGVAMGMILGEHPEDPLVILTDILGLEDALGTMDLKVAGNETGITAFQLDIKTEGLTLPILATALQQAKRGRMHILEVMREKGLSQPRDLKTHIPRVMELRIPVESIGKIIGPKGRTIQGLIEQHGLDSLDVADDGQLQLSSTSAERNEAARKAIMRIVDEEHSKGERGSGSGGGVGEVKEVEVEVGAIYRECAITGVQPFGLFVELLPGVEGLVHISEVDVRRFASIESAGLALGQKVDVKVLGRSDAGKLRLSRRAVLLRDSGREESADPLEKLTIKVAVKSTNRGG